MHTRENSLSFVFRQNNILKVNESCFLDENGFIFRK